MSYFDRVLDDGTDRARWERARWSVIGASDAAKLAKPESIESYLSAKLQRDGFHGNAFTESGNRWEPMMLAWAGITGNRALVHAPDEVGFAATPDGVETLPNGALRLAECKAKHGKVVNGPTLPEWRQIAWQFNAFPEADDLEFIWVELMNGEIRAGLKGEPKHLTIRRGDPKVQGLLADVLPIATDLLSRLRAALEFERQLAS